MTITKVRKADDDVKTYKLSEVALRNGSDLDEVWIIYKDTVYDVTKYMDKHPGGPELVMEYAGKDCTKGFNDAGHSLDAMKDLKKLKIGEIVEDDRKANRRKSKVFTNGEVKKKKRMGGFLFC